MHNEALLRRAIEELGRRDPVIGRIEAEGACGRADCPIAGRCE
jgi:hypothetical protein